MKKQTTRKKYRKRILCAALSCCLLMAAALTGCGEKTENDGEKTVLDNENEDAAQEYAGGDDENEDSGDKDSSAPLSGDVMKIGSAEDLVKFSERVSAGEDTLNTILTADIDMSGVCGENLNSWDPIGRVNKVEYNGIFDGDGHTIENLYRARDGETGDGGLFWILQENSIIRNLNLSNVNVDTEHGGSIALTTYGRIENCHGEGIVRGSQIGGLVGDGYYENAIMTGCSFSGRVEATNDAGGLACSMTRLEQCHNDATVTAIEQKSAGPNGTAAGIARSAGSATGCTNAGTVVGVYAAGIICSASKEAVIEDCINTGMVIGRTEAGGIADHYIEKASINRCGNEGIVRAGLAAGGIGVNCRYDITNCYQKGIVEAGPEIANAALSKAGFSEFATLEAKNLGDTNAAGIVCMGNRVMNCYSQGTITAEHTRSNYGNATGILRLFDVSNPLVANCYSTANISAAYEKWGIGKLFSYPAESCFYSEETASQGTGNEESEFPPTTSGAFTDGTVTAALNEWVKNAEGDYSAWKQGADGPCFEWEE